MAREDAVKDQTKANTAFNAAQEVLKGMDKVKQDSDLESEEEKDNEEDDSEEEGSYGEEGEEESDSN